MRHPGRTAGAAAALLVTLAAVAGCASGTASPTASASPSASGPTGSLTVFAAASLTESFDEIGTRFEASHPGTTVTFSFAGSSTLVAQLAQGAPADVFASADEANMAKAVDAKDVTATPSVFATNVLEIAVPPGNPARVRSFADLGSSSVRAVVCAPQVPCGAATQRIESDSGTTVHAVSQELSVTDVLSKVASGEADAGVVYVTDVRGAKGSVDGVPIADADAAVNRYPIAPVAGSAHAALAREFVSYVRSASGRRVLAAAGFGAP